MVIGQPASAVRPVGCLAPLSRAKNELQDPATAIAIAKTGFDEAGAGSSSTVLHRVQHCRYTPESCYDFTCDARLPTIVSHRADLSQLYLHWRGSWMQGPAFGISTWRRVTCLRPAAFLFLQEIVGQSRGQIRVVELAYQCSDHILPALNLVPFALNTWRLAFRTA